MTTNEPVLVSPPPAGTEPAPSAIALLFGVFAKPRATFAALASKPRLLAPIVVLLVAQLILAVVLLRSGVIRNDAIEQMEAKGGSADQIAAMEQFFDSPAMYVFGLIGPLLMVVVMILVSAALLYFMANLMLGARLDFRRYVCIASFASLIGLVDQVVRTAIGVGKGTLHVMLGVGAFFGDPASMPVRLLDSLTNPLLLWATAIEALGVSVMARKGFGFGVLAVVPGFILVLVLSSIRQ